MVICNHIIKDSQIVGIGALYEKSVGNYESQLVYGSYYLYFHLHLRTVSILIESSTLSRRGHSEELISKDKATAKGFRESYWEARKIIEKMIEN